MTIKECYLIKEILQRQENIQDTVIALTKIDDTRLSKFKLQKELIASAIEIIDKEMSRLATKKRHRSKR